MTAGRVFIAASLDGFIARKDGDIEWLTSLPPDEGGDYGYSPFLETVDGLVMGRGSFEKVATFELWPYPKPVVVLSRSMTQADIPAHLAGKVTVSAKTPREIMAELAERGWAGAYIDGGQVVQSFCAKA